MNFEEFLQPKKDQFNSPASSERETVQVISENTESVEENVETVPEELDVQKAVVEELAADKAALDDQISVLKQEKTSFEERVTNIEGELASIKGELSSEKEKNASLNEQIQSLKLSLTQKEAELSAEKAKEYDMQERNPNALALLDRDVEIADRFPGETRDHVIEVIREARDKDEKEGRLRRAQVLEAVLVANESNGTLSQKRAELEKLFADNGYVMTGPVIEELARLGIPHKNGEEYLLPSEIIKRNY